MQKRAISVRDISTKMAESESLRQKVHKHLSPLVIFAALLALLVSVLGSVFLDRHNFEITVVSHEIATEEDCHRECLAVHDSECEGSYLQFKVEWCSLATGLCTSNHTILEEDPTHVKHTKCEFTKLPEEWMPFTVISVLMVSIALIVDGAAAEIVLLGACCIFAATGVVSSKQAFGGLASSSVIGLGFLFAIASAIEETGMLEDLVGVLLGSPKNYYVALFRMMAPVAVLSAMLSNTAIVAMMIPIILTWARRLNVSAGKMLMPLSFAAQLGGSMTLIGSSHCLVAKESVPKAAYDMQFFDLLPTASMVCLATFFAIALCKPFLRSSAGPAEESPAAVDVNDEEASKVQSDEVLSRDAYQIATLVRQFSCYNGADSSETCEQLCRLPGVLSVKVADSEDTLIAGSKLQCVCTAEGVVAIRHVRGLALINESDLHVLGSHRRRRNLYETVVLPTSDLVGKKPDADKVRAEYGCGFLSIRGKQRLDAEVEANDVLLVEADHSYVATTEWASAFTLVKAVPHSSPPRFGANRDKPRAIATCLGMLLLVILVTAEHVKLSTGAGLMTIFLLLIRSRSLDQVYSSVKAPVLFVIAGAFGLSHALQDSGVAHCIAVAVTSMAQDFGVFGIRVAVYIVAVGLSMFINNSATVAIMGTMVAGMAKENAMHVSSLVWTLVLAAGSCFTTPLGYQTNMMVMPDGGYTFVDFMRYGFPVQSMHMVCTLAAVWFVSDYLGFEGF